MNDIPVPDMADKARDALVAHVFPEETMRQDDGLSVMCVINKIELYGKGAKA